MHCDSEASDKAQAKLREEAFSTIGLRSAHRLTRRFAED